MKSNQDITHFVAPIEETPLLATDAVKTDQAPLSLWADAWRKLLFSATATNMCSSFRLTCDTPAPTSDQFI